MTFQPVENVAEIRLQWQVGAAGSEFATIHACKNDGGWAGPQLDSLAEAVADWWTANVKALQTEGLYLREVNTRDLGDEFGAVGTFAVNDTGDIAGTQWMPYQNAVLVEWQCDAGSAPRRGHSFYPGVTEDQVTSGLLSSTAEDNWQAAMDALPPAISVDRLGNAMVIISRYSGFTLEERPDGTVRKKPTPRDPAIVNTLLAVDVKNRLGTIRHRRYAV